MRTLRQNLKQTDMHPLYFSTDPFRGHSYGPAHPMRLERLMLTTELLKAYDVLDFIDDGVFARVCAAGG